MNLVRRINDQLQRCPLGHAAEILSFDGQLRVALRLADCDRLGCLLEGLEIERSGDDQLAFDPVRIEAQVTYLGERLKTIETEEREGITIMRSLPPRMQGVVISYFEMVLERSKALSLVRYMYSPKLGRRFPVPTTMTRDTLERLIKDLIELAQEA